jgi:hypothetical protein
MKHFQTFLRTVKHTAKHYFEEHKEVLATIQFRVTPSPYHLSRKLIITIHKTIISGTWFPAQRGHTKIITKLEAINYNL